jgi:hypothetical protein
MTTSTIDRIKARPAPIIMSKLACSQLETGPVSQNKIGITPRQNPPSAILIRTMLEIINSMVRRLFPFFILNLFFPAPDKGFSRELAQNIAIKECA